MSPPDILLRITERRRERIAEAGAVDAEGWDEGAPRTPGDNPFLGALRGRRRSGPPAIIAEVKMGSPRLGSLSGRVDPVAQAQVYAAHGAAALSVVVEPDFFHGGYELLAACRQASGLPAIAKDFIVDPVQLLWARDAGADAILLIAALYEPAEMARYARLARGLGLVPLVETHDADDVAKLGGEPWEIVGINNRDLRTFDVSLATTVDLLPRIPPGKLVVTESGILAPADVARMRGQGVHAFLVGEAFMRADDPGTALATLFA